MRLTLIDAKTALAHKSPSDELEFRLSRVVERYLLSGKFAGSMLRLALQCQYGQLALPQEFKTLEGAQVGEQGRVFELANRWFRYLPGKGRFDNAIEVIQDFGDGEAIMGVPYLLPRLSDVANDYRFSLSDCDARRDFPAGVGTLQAAYSGATNYVVTIYGRDQDENPVALALPDKSPVANPFARIERIHTEQIPVAIRINFTLPAPDNRVIVIAIIDGVQTETFFRRYFIPALVNQSVTTVDAFVKRRFLAFASDQDTVPITNITALGLGLDAFALESEGDMSGAEQFWNKGIEILNLDLGDSRAADEIPSIRIHGLPRLTSHM